MNPEFRKVTAHLVAHSWAMEAARGGAQSMGRRRMQARMVNVVLGFLRNRIELAMVKSLENAFVNGSTRYCLDKPGRTWTGFQVT